MIIILNRREKMAVVMIVLILCTITFYYYMSQLQNNFQTDRSDEARCEEKLEQINYQLAAVTEYKHRIDKLLTETKKSYDNDKARFQDIMDSYVAMKQQCIFCQVMSFNMKTRLRAKTIVDRASEASKDFLNNLDDLAQFEDLQAECMVAKEQLKDALRTLETVKANQSIEG